jgi:hypothetical protein
VIDVSPWRTVKLATVASFKRHSLLEILTNCIREQFPHDVLASGNRSLLLHRLLELLTILETLTYSQSVEPYFFVPRHALKT